MNDSELEKWFDDFDRSEIIRLRNELKVLKAKQNKAKSLNEVDAIWKEAWDIILILTFLEVTTK